MTVLSLSFFKDIERAIHIWDFTLRLLPCRLIPRHHVLGGGVNKTTHCIHRSQVLRRNSPRIQRTLDAKSRARKDMGVDHRRPHIRMSEELLDDPDATSALQKVGRKRVSEGVTARQFVNTGSPNRFLHSPLDHRFMKMMATICAIAPMYA